MTTVRRWYMFLVCAISLQAVAWSIIALARNLLTLGNEAPVAAIAFQIAVIVIGLPIFLVHWLWAQRLAGKDGDEREAPLRRLYLYGTLAGFLGPFLANAFDLIAWLLWLAFGGPQSRFGFFESSPTDAILRHLAALVVLGLLWFYHQRLTAAETRSAPDMGSAATVRRLYIFGFSAAGVTMTTLGIIHLLRWIMLQLGRGTAITGPGTVGLTDEVARLIVGLPLWLIFWRWAQGHFAGPSEEERESALRKLYLYLTVFIAVLTAVSNAAIMLAGLIRRALDLPSTGQGLGGPLPVIAGAALLWAYHAQIVRSDAAMAGEAPRQAGVRRLYLYLVAAVGFAAFLVGLGGVVSVLIQSQSGEQFGSGLREQLAWSTAALIAGLPVWILPWRGAQLGAAAPGATGTEERSSVVRKIYLYFYLFVATMTVLSSAVYIVSQLLSLVLGEPGSGNLLGDLGQAIAFSLIAVGVWLYHGSALRGDSRFMKREHVERLARLRVAVVDVGEGRLGRAVLDGLRRELPDLHPDPIGLTRLASEAMGMGETQTPIAARLAGAELLVGPWLIAVAGGGNGAVTAEIASAVGASPGRKLLIPMWTEGWEWAGVERWNADSLVRQTVRGVKQILEGEEVKPIRPLGMGAIIGIAIGVLILMILLLIPVILFFAGGGF